MDKTTEIIAVVAIWTSLCRNSLPSKVTICGEPGFAANGVVETGAAALARITRCLGLVGNSTNRGLTEFSFLLLN